MRRIPRFSIVLTIGDAEDALSEVAASIDAVRLDPGGLEVIAVDLGSTDATPAILRMWSRRSPWAVRVLRGSSDHPARYRGVTAATGKWILFLDEDELLTDGSLQAADRLLAGRHGVDLEVAALLRADAASHRRGRLRVIDLREEPHGLAMPAVLLFRRDALPEVMQAPDPRAGPEFQPRELAARLIMAGRAPVLGLVDVPGYRPRERRGDASVTVRSRPPDPYVDVLRHGHVELLRLARRTYGHVPVWIQHLLIDELTTWVRDGGPRGRPTNIEPGDSPVVRGLLREVVSQLEGDVVRAYPFTRSEPAWLDVLLHGCRESTWHAPQAWNTKTDRASGLSRINYTFVGERPIETMTVAGEQVGPVHAKTMEHRYVGLTLLQERILWVRLSTSFELRLDGRATPIMPAPPDRPGQRKAVGLSFMRRLLRKGRRGKTKVERWLVRLIARVWPYSERFRDAWVLMDRINDADDNGQRLFEYLRENRPDINAWFVVRGGSDAWNRMRAAGADRLVAHGSFRWKLLMEAAAWLISSHAKKSIVDPRALRGVVDHWRWRYGFLQHGVIQSDLSRWMNKLDIDLFVTSTPPELESIVADGTTYRYTSREMRLTGLPRWDRLLAKDRAIAPEDRNLVLVAPTWRKWLTLPLDPRSWRRPVDASFWESQYLREWTGLLGSPEIAEAAARRGWRIAFMPHPNLQPVLPELELPPHVEPISYAGTDVQGVFARAAVFVTDYSSLAFDLASIERPVVYFHFETQELFSGAHVGDAGYFDYVRDGFGPVATSAAAAVAAIVAAIEHGSTPTPLYRERIRRTFTQCDGGACARVVAAIETFDQATGWMPASRGDGPDRIAGPGSPRPPLQDDRVADAASGGHLAAGVPTAQPPEDEQRQVVGR